MPARPELCIAALDLWCYYYYGILGPRLPGNGNTLIGLHKLGKRQVLSLPSVYTTRSIDIPKVWRHRDLEGITGTVLSAKSLSPSHCSKARKVPCNQKVRCRARCLEQFIHVAVRLRNVSVIHGGVPASLSSWRRWRCPVCTGGMLL